METKKQAKKTKELIAVKSDTKKLSTVGKWLNDPNAKPWIKIIDMKAILK
jgi:hypothetical protein